MRYATPIVMTLAALGIFAFNTTQPDQRIVFPFVERVVGSNPDTMGLASAALCGCLAAISALWTYFRPAPPLREDP